MSLTRRAVRGVKWTTISQFGRQALQLASLAVLAKFLEEEDFGVMALGMAIAELARAFYYSLSSSIIQRRALDDGLLSSVHWFSTGMGATFGAVIFLLAGGISDLLRSHALESPLEALSVVFFFFGVTVAPQALLERNLEFDKVAQSEVAASFLSSGTGITLAVLGYGVWALVFQWIVVHGTVAALFWTRARWAPRLRFSLADIRSIAGYSANLSGFHIINYFSRNADKFVVGGYLGSQALGYYSLAYRMMLYSSTTISTIVNRVMFPYYSRVQTEIEKFRDAYLRSSGAIALLAFPMMLGIATISEEIVVVVFNPEWREAVSAPLAILALAGLVQSILFANGSVFQAAGRTDRMFLFGAITAVFSLAGFFIGLPWGVVGVATGYLVANVLLLAPGLALSLPLISTPFTALLRRLAPSFFAATGMVAVVLLLKSAMADVNVYLRFVALVLGGGVVYAALAWAFGRSQIEDLLQAIRGGSELAHSKGGVG
ncbi:MAG: oligosaccharide flippase family protein [Ignavibacteriales bacterium]|nr:oligosaccharide flippase family protein [Ignavibacteriales bacterium]